MADFFLYFKINYSNQSDNFKSITQYNQRKTVPLLWNSKNKSYLFWYLCFLYFYQSLKTNLNDSWKTRLLTQFLYCVVPWQRLDQRMHQIHAHTLIHQHRKPFFMIKLFNICYLSLKQLFKSYMQIV